MFVINFIGRKSNKMMLKKTINKALSFSGAKVLRMRDKKTMDCILFYDFVFAGSNAKAKKWLLSGADSNVLRVFP